MPSKMLECRARCCERRARYFGRRASQACKILLSGSRVALSTMSSLRELYVDPSNAWSFVPSVPASSEQRAAIKHPQPVLRFTANPYATHLLRSLVASAVLQYTSSALVNPWQVGKLLLQTQWVPRDAGEPVQDFEVEDSVRFHN